MLTIWIRIPGLQTTNPQEEGAKMCDFSLEAIASRPAKVGDKLVTKSWGTGTIGVCDLSDPDTAVCLLPGTELAFTTAVETIGFLTGIKHMHYAAVFRHRNEGKLATHHDSLEFPDGSMVYLTTLITGQELTVLQLPVAEKPTEKTPTVILSIEEPEQVA
jgi:hypothetical protein